MSSSEDARSAPAAGAQRGACTACGAFYPLTTDGTVRGHPAALASRDRCPGSDRKPVATA